MGFVGRGPITTSDRFGNASAADYANILHNSFLYDDRKDVR